MNLVDRIVSPRPEYCIVPSRPRPILGWVFHHSAVSFPVDIRAGASWHYQILKDGTIWQQLPDSWIAYHTGLTDVWRPLWVVTSPYRVSDINYCSLGVEIVYAPQHGEVPTVAQLQAVGELIAAKEREYGRLAAVGHGEVDSGKWRSEPHLLDWYLAGFGPRHPDLGRFWVPPAVPIVPIIDPDLEDALTPIIDGEITMSKLAALTDEQIAAVGQYLWGDVPFVLETGVAQEWAAALREGRYLGVPVGGEAHLEHGIVVQQFTKGTDPVVAVYAPEIGTGFAV